MTFDAVPETTPLTEADAGFVYFAQPGRWWSIHVEVHFAGRLDPERLRSAALDACERHPLARARMASVEPGDRTYRWEIQEHANTPELEVVDCAGEGAPSLTAARDRVLASAPRLDVAPPFRLALLHGVEGDALILHLHHAACDGQGAWRLLTSIMRSYAGLEDPVPAFEPLQARDLRPLVAANTRRERLRRLVKLPAVLAHSKPVRVAPDGAGGSGEGVRLISFEERETAVLEQRRGAESTLNDVLLGGLVLAIRHWNGEHGARPGRIALTVPVNLRSPSWREEVLGNFASAMPVSIPKGAADGLDELVATATKRTQKAKRDHTAHALFDVLPKLMGMMSISRKERLGSRKPEAVERMQDTAVFSNLGRLTLPDLGGQAGPVRAAWFTPPAGFTRGFAVGALSYEGCLQLGLRYQRAHLSDAAAAAFAEVYRAALLGDEEEGEARTAGYSSTTSVSPSLTA